MRAASLFHGDKMMVIMYSRIPEGQLFYDLAFTDLSEPWLARKHKMPRIEVNRLRLLARETLIGKRKLSKAARQRAVESAVALNRVVFGNRRFVFMTLPRRGV